MEILLYIAALIAAVAFAVLVIYLSKVLKATQRTMSNVANTLEGLEKQMEGITIETTALLNKTNKLAEDINEKSLKMNTLFDGIKGIGQTVQEFNESLKTLSSSVSNTAEKNKNATAQAMKWGTVALDLWNKRKKKETGGIDHE
ncbi:DUF948 domain-containing protein [Radiobacillus deserti]|uniref:DUF948 domain-containing protein n=1 Tax=Radiobacillus deserti TaxID=2594883 RepID=A0A516KHN6_9BACI|nr:DUF948 domain-containing protein [Radiobacillus deserti]QDP40899.1 DUF948 domain-containing protein [Radiobacillus deserti]